MHHEYVVQKAVYNISDELRNPLRYPYRRDAATFVRNNTLYFWGGEGRWSDKGGIYRDVVTYFQAVRFNQQNGSLEYSFVQNSYNYTNFTVGAAAVLLPDSDRVLFFGGYSQRRRGVGENVPLYLSEYNFVDGTWRHPTVRSVAGAPLPNNKGYMAATMGSDGLVYLVGRHYTGDLDEITADTTAFWTFNPSTELFTPLNVSSPPFWYGWFETPAIVLSDGRILYIPVVGSPVFILDPTTGRLLEQVTTGGSSILGGGTVDPSSENPINLRYGGFAFRAPLDGTKVYYYGGYLNTPADSISVIPMYTDIATLDIETWTWTPQQPTENTDRAPIVPRFSPSVALLNDEYLMVAFGKSTFEFTNEFDILKLPEASPSDPFTSIANVTGNLDDNIPLIEGFKGNTKNQKTTIIIVVALVLALILSLLAISPCRRKVKRGALIVWSFLFWKPRSGESLWTEFSHLVFKLILTGIFIGYMVYNVNRVIDSPTSTLTITETVNELPCPDIRFCFENALNISFYCYSDAIPTKNCETFGYLLAADPSKRYPYSNDTKEATETLCWLFRPNSSFTFNAESSNSNKVRFYYGSNVLIGFDIAIRIDLYRSDSNPNIGMLRNSSKPAPEKDEWLQMDLLDTQYKDNRYTVSRFERTSIGYQLQTRKRLKDTVWNMIGLSQIYEVTSELQTTIETRPPNNASFEGNMIEIFPIGMTYTTLQDQRNFTFLTVLGPVAGLLSLLITLDSFFFGTRPKSPWGVIHWVLWRKKSLLKNLREKFGFLGRPIPFVHPVDERFFDRDNQAMIQAHGLITDTPESKIELLEEQLQQNRKLTHELLRRTQLTELMHKAYYINDEVYWSLNEAYDKENDDASTTS
ncbi:hypothetical protein BJV82DRAFT_661228 [Fennellomyces sp. T-0311]|nr:hypothetical protein BJV82DRAFT_661228 [Fennellomyces sp. T-0311]